MKGVMDSSGRPVKFQPQPFVSVILALVALALNFSLIPSAKAYYFTNTGSLNTAREYHTATLLPNGKVLVTGGSVGFSPEFIDATTNTAELFDPATGTWTLTGSMHTAREFHTATLLANGKVLVTGGIDGSNVFSSSELFDTVTGTWTIAESMRSPRAGHAATLLANGKVLVAGGFDGTNTLSNAELYDPATGHWSPAGAMSDVRLFHTATLLSNGKVLIAGGAQDVGVTASAELYDPVTGIWAATGAMNTNREDHTATLLPNGWVLVAGGDPGGNPYFGAELYDPATGLWTTTGTMTTNRENHTATLLPNGKVLVTAGFGGTNTSELFDPVSGVWTTNSTLAFARGYHTATLMADGRVLVAGGRDINGDPLSSTELFECANGTWTYAGSMNVGRSGHSAILLSNGLVLVAGGMTNGPPNGYTSTAELYDPSNGTWTNTGSMTTPYPFHSANLLPNGKVLVIGAQGVFFVIAGAELYDPATGVWTNTATMNTARAGYTATLLPNGKILVVGGSKGFLATNTLSSAELYDPASETWTYTGSLNAVREGQTATLLASGKVLVAGGYGSNFVTLSSAELYDPSTGIWTNTGSMNTARLFFSATLLPSGTVLVAGGSDGTQFGPAYSSAELYDPLSRTWTFTGSMNTARQSQHATLLPDGKVLIGGGESRSTFGSLIFSQELYDPPTGAWTVTGALNTTRTGYTPTLLPNGQVLVAGGMTQTNDMGLITSSITNTSELYNVGLGYSNSWQPQITSITSPLNLGGNLAITGSQFRGISEGSSGNGQSSPSDHPLVQLRSLESGQILFLPSTNWSASNFLSSTVLNFPPGWALATVFVNGIPSTSSIVNINVPVPTPPVLTGATTQPDGSFQFGFTNTVGALFGVLATTDLSQPVTNWTALGGVTENPPGQFQFTDPQATNFPQRFYNVRVP
jgi:N-acetylneuraminic acid mutarotase